MIEIMKAPAKKQAFVQIPRTEYLRLKKMARAVAAAEYRKAVEEGREDFRAGRSISQEDLFKELGL